MFDGTEVREGTFLFLQKVLPRSPKWSVRYYERLTFMNQTEETYCVGYFQITMAHFLSHLIANNLCLAYLNLFSFEPTTLGLRLKNYSEFLVTILFYVFQAGHNLSLQQYYPPSLPQKFLQGKLASFLHLLVFCCIFSQEEGLSHLVKQVSFFPIKKKQASPFHKIATVVIYRSATEHVIYETKAEASRNVATIHSPVQSQKQVEGLWNFKCLTSTIHLHSWSSPLAPGSTEDRKS